MIMIKKTSKNIFFPLILTSFLLFVSVFIVAHAEVNENNRSIQTEYSSVESQQVTVNQNSGLRAVDTADSTEEQAAPDGAAGQILKTHVCPIDGYKLIISRPAGFPENASERVIQVEKMNRSFHAIWTEVQTIINNTSNPSDLDYHQVQNPGASGERFCNRNGHMIPTDTNVWQVSLAHYNDYNGSTSIFSDNNIETAPLHMAIAKYNQRRDQGDALPNTCNYGCLDGNSGGPSPTDPWGNINFGGIDFGDTDPRKPWENNGVDGNTGGVDGEPGVGDGAGTGGHSGGVVDTAHIEVADNYFEGDQERTAAPQTTQGEAGIDIIDPDDIIAPAQDYNSTRSNRRKNEFFNPDEDDEDEDTNIATVSAERLATIKNDPPTVRCGSITAKADGGGEVYCWGHGIRAAAVGNSNDDGAIATNTRVLQSLSVNGKEVRMWSDAEKAQLRGFLSQQQEETTPEQVAARLAKHVIENDSIEHIELIDSEITIKHQTEVRLFGFIPLRANAITKIDSSDTENTSYPWWSFLARKNTTPMKWMAPELISALQNNENPLAIDEMEWIESAAGND